VLRRCDDGVKPPRASDCGLNVEFTISSLALHRCDRSPCQCSSEAVDPPRTGQLPRVDIHFHLLPGLDDGPATMEESVELAAAAERDWTSTVVATPHVRLDQVTDVSQLPDRVAELEDRLEREGVQLSVCCGAELGHEMVGRLGQHELDTIAVGPPGARWLLLEAPFEGFDDDVHAAADELRQRGFGVVIAHPERAAGAVEAIQRELRAGSVLQLNAWSLNGDHGEAAQRAAFSLLGDGSAGLIASDAHGGWRAPGLSFAFEEMVGSGIGEATARRLTDEQPIRLLTRGIPLRVPALAA
jgi:protein-tyrosine phosphatase